MNTIQYKCPNCGAELTFQPDTQDFACHFCNCNFSESEIQTRYARMEQEAEQSADQNTKTAADTSDFEDGTKLYHCPNCGAQIIADEETSATFCYYCHSPVMLSGRLSGEYRPAYVIPFAISREKVTEQFHQ